MSAAGKYRAIAVDTLEERQRHQNFLRRALENTQLSPEQRLELEAALKRATQSVDDARHDVEDADSREEEEKKKKTDGDDGDGSQGDTGGGQSSGGNGGSGDGGVRWESAEVTESDESSSDLDLVELLFVLDAMSTPAMDMVADEPVAAATLAFDYDQGVASLDQAYSPAQPHQPGAHYEHYEHAALLPSLEHHAVTKGAHVMQVLVHA
ncbi:MAG: hypothetical protein KGI37_09585, partial [Alphaproteobacteria bacterium]|nr:hypothetical protein [Alphaproteobacteria bacterium]